MEYKGMPLVVGEPITLTVTFTEEEWAKINERAAPKIEARIQAEMAACPYVACTCGYHGCDDCD